MFYCDSCRQENQWPESFVGSYGPCEVCGNVTFCNDRSSDQLPPARITKVDPATGAYINKKTGEPATGNEVRLDSVNYQEWRDYMNHMATAGGTVEMRKASFRSKIRA